MVQKRGEAGCASLVKVDDVLIKVRATAGFRCEGRYNGSSHRYIYKKSTLGNETGVRRTLGKGHASRYYKILPSIHRPAEGRTMGQSHEQRVANKVARKVASFFRRNLRLRPSEERKTRPAAFALMMPLPIGDKLLLLLARPTLRPVPK